MGWSGLRDTVDALVIEPLGDVLWEKTIVETSLPSPQQNVDPSGSTLSKATVHLVDSLPGREVCS